jgi:flagellar biosynthetic protein FlhB
MSTDQDRESKTEEPTSKRLKKASEEGNFAKAEEIQVVFALAASFIVIMFYAGTISESLYLYMQSMLANLSEFEINAITVAEGFKTGGARFLFLLMPLLTIVMVAAILAGGLQSGFNLAPKALQPKMNKLNVLNNAKQKFGKQAWAKFAVDLIKLICVAAVIACAIQRMIAHPIFYTPLDAFQVALFIRESTLYMLSLLIVGVAVAALLNYLYQKRKVMGDLRMTKQEVKDELKQAEGDQQVKGARRRLAQKLTERQMFSAIPGADVVITNPTHYAVALRYDRDKDSSPLILAKGKNLIAQRIKGIAREHGVPMVENRPAAQALYKIGEPGKQIPPQLFQVVAEILAFVYRNHRAFFHRRRVSLRQA